MVLRDAPGQPSDLYLHKSGQWAKTIKGKKVYFGRSKDEALVLWGKERTTWLAGGNPRAIVTEIKVGVTNEMVPARSANGEATLAFAVYMFLEAENEKRTTINQITQRQKLSDSNYCYKKTALNRLISYFGGGRVVNSIYPDEWRKFHKALCETWKLGPQSVNHHIMFVRQLARFAKENHLIATEVEFGKELPYATRGELGVVQARAAHVRGAKVFPPAQIPLIMAKCDTVSLAMFLLGLNGGFTSIDLAHLPMDIIDLENGIIDYNRRKTGVRRCVTLWPETVEALKNAMMVRPQPSAEWQDKVIWTDPVTLRKIVGGDLAFITRTGKPWVRRYTSPGNDNRPDKAMNNDAISFRFGRQILPSAGEGVKRPGINFSTVRHTLRTVVSDHPDLEAKRWIMGHTGDYAGRSLTSVEKHYIHFTPAAIDAIRSVTDLARARLLPHPGKVTVTDFIRRPPLLPFLGDSGVVCVEGEIVDESNE